MSEIIPPPMSDEQRREALRQANQVRRLRADDKALIRSRKLDPRTILANPPEHWKAARIAYLLRGVPGVGRIKVDRILETQGVSPVKTIAGLSPQQRQRLSESLDRYYA